MLAPSLTIAEEPVADIIETELWPLLVEHRDELTTNKALMELAPDVERYRAAEAAGAVLALIAREGGRVVGYSINFVSQHIHYMRMTLAANDVLYVAKSHRARLGLRLIDATEAAAREHGAHLVAWHAKPGTHLEAILRRRARKGYRVQDVIFTREL
jgi:GNAT superfamily N-acetyltransferase